MSEYSGGLEEIFAQMDSHHREQEERIDQAVQGAGISCQAKTKQRCPVGTPESTGKKGYIGGRLRSSYQYKRGWLEAKVYTNVFYGSYVELGTKKMAARPHLFPSFVEAGRELGDELKSIGA